jgi:hypothetical protein
MSQPELRTRAQLITDAIARLRAYTDLIQHYGANSVGRAMATLVASHSSYAVSLYRALLRRYTLIAAEGADLTIVAEEHGAERLTEQRAKLMVIVAPKKATVSAITIAATDKIEVDDSTPFDPGDSIRIRSEDGATSEVATIIAITTGTGPGGGDELEVATLANAYSPGSEDVRVLLRVTLPIGTVINTSPGEDFTTLFSLTTGDANPVMVGEGTHLGLADKVWCEAVEKGAAANVEPLSVTGLAVPNDKISRVFNPEAGSGGHDAETDYDLKYRASHGPVRAGQETLAWAEQIARDGDADVLRVIRTTTTAISTLPLKVLHRNGGPLGESQRVALEEYMQQRVRSFMLVDLQELTLTAVEVQCTITLENDAVLRDVWKAAAGRLAAFLDYRKWSFGADVDEAELLAIVRQTSGVAGLVTSTFLPAADVAVDDESLPVLTRLTLTDQETGDVLNAELSVGF